VEQVFASIGHLEQMRAQLGLEALLERHRTPQSGIQLEGGSPLSSEGGVD
jgi:hypothetical protein